MTGQLLKQARELAGLTIEQAGEFLGYDRSTIWKFEQADEIPVTVERALWAMRPGVEAFDSFVASRTMKQQRAIARRQQRWRAANAE